MNRRKASEMFPLVEQYQNGELRREAFCELHGIPMSTLAYWVGKYRRTNGQKGESNFIEVELDPVSGTSYQMEVQTRKGHVIRFRHLVPIDYLFRLLEL